MNGENVGIDGYIVISSDRHVVADVPHHEGTAPYSRLAFRGTMAHYPEDGQLLSATAADLYDADLDFLEDLTGSVGPTVEEVNAPLHQNELPEDQNLGSASRHMRA